MQPWIKTLRRVAGTLQAVTVKERKQMLKQNEAQVLNGNYAGIT
jgi:hypothetical protein